MIGIRSYDNSVSVIIDAPLRKASHAVKFEDCMLEKAEDI